MLNLSDYINIIVFFLLFNNIEYIMPALYYLNKNCRF